MPSIEAVEQFKAIVRDLSGEPAIRLSQKLPPEEILPPESGLTDDLADLLGGMPLESPSFDEGEGQGIDLDSDPSNDAEQSQDLDDLFNTPIPEHDEEDTGPSLDDLLGPTPTADDVVLEADPFAAEADPFATEADPFADPFAATPDTFGEPLEDSAEPLEEFGDPLEDLDNPADGLGGMDDLLGEFDNPPALDDPGTAGDFFDAPAASSDDNLFPDPAGSSPDEEFQFAGDSSDADFPELAGFADTKEEDVEAFDAMGVADEFGLGDFESQFGITADDHTDPELLNPAQSIDLEIEAAQKTLSLSEEEFHSIQQALAHLPLNLRLAVEELIGERDIVFEDLDKVVALLVARAPARTLATVVGRILGKKIVIPAGFEKGSGAEIEAQHATLWYNMRTIMLPIIRVSLVVTAVAAVLVLLGWNFLLKPLKANDLYEKGLEEARQNNGQVADDLFAQAWYEWPVQDRFFEYAETYQEVGDYDRSRRKYLELLKPSVRPFVDSNKALLKTKFSDPLAPLPKGLTDAEVDQRMTARKAVLEAWYAYLVRLLSTSPEADRLLESDISGEVLFANPNEKALLDLSRLETEFGFDGRDREAHFQRADKVLESLFAGAPNHQPALLRKGDNQLAWAEALSSAEHLEVANRAYSQYMQVYGKDATITWRFVSLFLVTDDEEELLALKDGILLDTKLETDGEVAARLAQWLLDRDEARLKEEEDVPEKMLTLEEEYGIVPPINRKAEEEAEEAAHQAALAAAEEAKKKAAEPPPAAEGGGHGEAAAPAAPAAGGGHSLARSGAAPAGGHSGGEAEGAGAVAFDPPYKYPNSKEPFRPDYLESLDKLVIRAMETQKELPELHFQLSRYYRSIEDTQQEMTALAAADTYFQRLKPRLLRLNDRPAMRVATLNRIGEVFVLREEPLQAEQYFLEAQEQLEAFLGQKLVSLNPTTAVIYRNLGNLYYQQTPGTAEARTAAGGWEEALKLYEKAEAGQLEDPLITYRKGVILYELGEYNQAVKEFFALDKKSSNRGNWNLLFSMANTLFRNGNFFAAEGYYRELLGLLLEKRSRIAEFDVAIKRTDRALAQRIFQTYTNLGASLYRGARAYKAGTREFRESLTALTTAQGMAITLGLDIYGSREEFDITQVNDQTVQALRDEQARIVALTRKEKGLVEANLQVLSLLETTPAGRRSELVQDLEIFAGLPLEMDQLEAP